MKFEILIGPDDGSIVELERDKVRIGRYPDPKENDLFLFYDEWVSRKHAEVVKEDMNFKVRDRGSKHGTGIKGRSHLGKGEESVLRPDDILIIGRIWIKFIG